MERGHLITDLLLYAFERGDDTGFVLDAPASRRAVLEQKLDMFHFGEDLSWQTPEVARLLVLGPQAEARLRAHHPDLPLASNGPSAEPDFGLASQDDSWLLRRPDRGIPCFEWVGPPERSRRMPARSVKPARLPPAWSPWTSFASRPVFRVGARTSTPSPSCRRSTSGNVPPSRRLLCRAGGRRAREHLWRGTAPALPSPLRRRHRALARRRTARRRGQACRTCDELGVVTGRRRSDRHRPAPSTRGPSPEAPSPQSRRTRGSTPSSPSPRRSSVEVMRTRRLLSWVVALVAVAFFGSVACPPLSERPAGLDAESSAERETLADRGPARVNAPQGGRAERLPEPESDDGSIDDLHFLVVDAIDREPVPGASVHLEYVDPSRRLYQLDREVDAAGRLVWEDLALIEYRIHARHRDWTSSEVRTVTVPASFHSENPLVLELQPAVHLEVQIDMADGGDQVRGWLKCTHLASGEYSLRASGSRRCAPQAHPHRRPLPGRLGARRNPRTRSAIGARTRSRSRGRLRPTLRGPAGRRSA